MRFWACLFEKVLSFIHNSFMTFLIPFWCQLADIKSPWHRISLIGLVYRTDDKLQLKWFWSFSFNVMFLILGISWCLKILWSIWPIDQNYIAALASQSPWMNTSSDLNIYVNENNVLKILISSIWSRFPLKFDMAIRSADWRRSFSMNGLMQWIAKIISNFSILFWNVFWSLLD